jgi:pimeloyl-ACP methyl ester carboxylesterase
MQRWVLLRGLMRERRHWENFTEQLQRALPDAAIATPDLPGNGRLHRLRSPARIAAMVEACREELRRAGLAPPYHLCALSLGGMVALEWSARYPREIAAVVLINTSMRPFSPFYRRLQWRNYGAIFRLLLPSRLPRAARQEALVLRLTSAKRAQDEALLRRWIGYRNESPVSLVNGARQLLAAARYHAPAQRPEAPMLVLAGGADRLVDPRCSRDLAAAWKLPLREHPHAGHDLPLDEGEWVAAQVAAWLASSNSRI